MDKLSPSPTNSDSDKKDLYRGKRQQQRRNDKEPDDSDESGAASLNQMSFNANSRGSDQEISERVEEEEIEEEIEEVLSGDVSVQEESNKVKGGKDDDIQKRTRQLFDLDLPKGGDDNRKDLYDNDDLLSGDKIAEHFNLDDVEGDSLDQYINDIEEPPNRDISPQNDVILINDQKVSINSLKEKQDQGTISANLSTTNDVSDLAKDQMSALSRSKSYEIESSNIKSYSERGSKSLDIDPNRYSQSRTSDQDEEEQEEEHISQNDSIEENKSAEEILVSNHSIEISNSDQSNLGSNRSENEKSKSIQKSDASDKSDPVVQSVVIKPMERCLDFGKEVLEDISEESEHVESLESLDKLQVYTINKTNDNKIDLLKKTNSDHSFFSPRPEQQEKTSTSNAISLPIASVLENQVNLENIRQEFSELNKENLLSSLPNYLETSSRRESGDSLRDSIVTTSTQYRTIQDEYINKMVVIQKEFLEKDKLIEELTDTLQETLQLKEQLQENGEKLAEEVIGLKKQLSEAVETLKRTQNWNQDEVGSQRISEVSLDLVSDEESEKNFTDVDRRSREKESKEREDLFDQFNLPVSQQIEQFQTYLSPEELQIFFMVQKKFDVFLNQEVEKAKVKFDDEIKILNDRLESEKSEKENELKRLRELLTNIKHGSSDLLELKQELEVKHSHEMESLRRYFEKKCADMEKHYSEEVFSQQSQKHSLDSGSDLSDVEENLPLETKLSPRKVGVIESYQRSASQKNSPRKSVNREEVANLSSDELKAFYDGKIKDISENYNEQLQTLKEKLKRYEAQQADDELMPNQIDPTNSNQNELTEIIAEYERRLQEQVVLARQDILVELERHIQALLSETATEDSHWPPELILLREKFTAKNQLEITQLQIKHEEDMSRLKIEHERQLQRKLKRNTTFDSNRNLDQVTVERDNLRELSITLRRLLRELAKYCAICENDLNETLAEELKCHGALDNNNDTVLTEDGPDPNISNLSTLSTVSQKKILKYNLDVSNILSVIDDPSLVKYISPPDDLSELEFNLEQCLEQLKNEASYILKLSEKISNRGHRDSSASEKDDSCEEEDGLKKRNRTLEKRQASFNENLLLNGHQKLAESNTHSLPIFKNVSQSSSADGGENIHFNELKNRLLKSEDEKKSLQEELTVVKTRNNSLAQELSAAQEMVEVLELRREYVSEGFGSNPMSPVNPKSGSNPRLSFTQLQEKAKNILNVPQNTAALTESGNQLLQLIEEFCREGDRTVDETKREKKDLQEQNQKHYDLKSDCDHSNLNEKIDAADKQLRATRQFLEEQAAEREQERDEFSKEIEKLKAQIRDREKDRTSQDRLTKEDEIKTIEVLEAQIKELTQTVTEDETKRQHLEEELKASVDKIFVLREIIADLEMQIESKNLAENVLREKMAQLESFVGDQNRTNESLQNEVESLKYGSDRRGYQERINDLEDQLKSLKPSAEQSLMFEQFAEQLKEIETILETKTKTLESLHMDICSQSCSSPSEDISVKHHGGGDTKEIVEDLSPRSSNPSTYTVDRLQRIMERLTKHGQAEQAAIKRIKDLEMQVNGVRNNNLELQHERDALQERMSEQLLRISSLQSRLDERRHRAEELHRQGTSDLTLRVHDLQVELNNLKETLESREKQIATLKSHLEQSKQIIDRQEVQLAQESESKDQNEEVRRLATELHEKSVENAKLKEKIKTEMANKIAVPDLMETILAEKNEEIDNLREDLQKKQQQLKVYLNLALDADQKEMVMRMTENEEKLSARTLSDVVSISDYDVPDVARRAESRKEGTIPDLNQKNFTATFNIPKPTPKTEERRIESAFNENLITLTPEPMPRHIDFSLVEDDSKERNVDEEIFKYKAELKAKIEENSNLKIELSAKIKVLEILKSEKINLQLEVDEMKLKVDKVTSLEGELEKRGLDVKNLTEKISSLEEEIKERNSRIENLDKLVQNNNSNKDSEVNSDRVLHLEHEIETLKLLLSKKEEHLNKVEKDVLNFARIEQNYDKELTVLRNELITKSLELEKCKLDLDESINNVLRLHIEMEKFKENANQLKPFAVEEIAEKLEEELNYSAKLDSSILKAIESDEINSEDDNDDENVQKSKSVKELIEQTGNLDDELKDLKQSLHREAIRNEELLIQNNELNEQLTEFKQKYETERNNCIRMQLILESEKKNSTSIQQQDAELLDAMRLRLEEALENEIQLHKLVEEERGKIEKLSSQINVIQRSKSRDSLLKSPVDSPRRSNKAVEQDSDLVMRLESEVKLLSAQNEREKERVKDLQQVLDREKIRFEKDVSDHKEHHERLTKELNRVSKEKEYLQDELDILQEKLILSKNEIESLEARISNFEDCESRQATRRGRERLESTQNSLENHDLRQRLQSMERERDHLQEQVNLLRSDIERSAQREIRLAEALSKESSMEGMVPEQFLIKLKEMNKMLSENKLENRQMTETVQRMKDERLLLQRRINELEGANPQANLHNRVELEERANHLFGKYLRVESFRKALVHQKRYLLIVLASYQETEANALALVQAQNGPKPKRKKRTSFRAAAMVIVAIERMKFIVRRWQTGKRVGAKAIFSSAHALPRRSASASTNIWARTFTVPDGLTASAQHSPPSHDRSNFSSNLRPLQAPTLLTDLTENSPVHKFYRH